MSFPIVNFPEITFQRHKSLQSENNSRFKVTPVLVDFEQLLKVPKDQKQETFSGIPNAELLHAVATLYGVSLSEITEDIIYPLLSEKWSKTLLMILDEAQAGEMLKKSLITHSNNRFSKSIVSSNQQQHHHHHHHKKSHPEKKPVDPPTDDRFVNIFSDDENSNDNDSDDNSDENDLIKSVDDFLQIVDERKKAQQQWLETHRSRTIVDSHSDSEPPPLGIEHRLIACATFECCFKKPSEKVLLLSLIAVRKKYRNTGIGSFMIQQLFNPAVTGGSDVIVVNADPSATEFFERHGFTDDVILNTRYADIGDVWFNSKRMCYLQGYTKGKAIGDNYYSLREMEMEISQWKESSTESYQHYASIIQRMKHEIVNLQSQVNKKESAISDLKQELIVRSSHHMNLQKNFSHILPSVSNQSSSACDVDSIPIDIRNELCSSSRFDESNISASQPGLSNDYAILSQFLFDSMKPDGSRKQSIDHSGRLLTNNSIIIGQPGHHSSLLPSNEIAKHHEMPQSSKMQPGMQSSLHARGRSTAINSPESNLNDPDYFYPPSSVNSFASTNYSGNIALDGYTSHVALDQGLHCMASNKSLLSQPSSNELMDYYQQSTNGLRSFMERSTNEFQGFAQKSQEEFQNFAKLSNDFRELFILEIKRCFLNSVSNQGSTLPCDKTQVLDVIVAELPQEVTSSFSDAVVNSHDSDIVTNLYFCGGEHHRSNYDSFNRIIRSGFSVQDFVESEFGKGLHFSQHANSATYFSPNGHVLVAQVCLGRNQTVIVKDSRRVQPPEGFDSILTQGRLSDSRYNLSSHGDFDCGEYIVFDHNMALPLAIIKYQIKY